MTQKIDFSLVVACYCEEPHIFKNIVTLFNLFAITRWNVEIIFVEDASPDKTKQEVERCLAFLKERGVATKAIFHTKNQGRGATVSDGFRIAEGECIGFIDIDLEHQAECLLPMVAQILRGDFEGVIARRISDRTSPSRFIASHAYRLLVRSVLTLPVHDSEAGLKVFNRNKILPVLEKTKDPSWFWDTEIVDRAARDGLKLTEHNIIYHRDPNKKSTVKLIRDSWRYFVTLFKYKMSV